MPRSNETLSRRGFMSCAVTGAAVTSLTIYGGKSLTGLNTAGADSHGLEGGPHVKHPASDRPTARVCGDPRSDACLTCNQCTEACPHDVPVADLMRIRKYNDEYGWRDRARAEYKALGEDLPAMTARCHDCTVCGRVCPVGLADSLLVKDITSTFS